jgi:hypothetical protein
MVWMQKLYIRVRDYLFSKSIVIPQEKKREIIAKNKTVILSTSTGKIGLAHVKVGSVTSKGRTVPTFLNVNHSFEEVKNSINTRYKIQKRMETKNDKLKRPKNISKL